MKDALPCFLVFAGRDNHSRIWNGDSDAGNDLGKSIVVDSVVKLIGIDIVGVFQTRNADRVWYMRLLYWLSLLSSCMRSPANS